MTQASPLHIQVKRPPRIVDFTSDYTTISKVPNKNLKVVDGISNHALQTFMVPANRECYQFMKQTKVPGYENLGDLDNTEPSM